MAKRIVSALLALALCLSLGAAALADGVGNNLYDGKWYAEALRWASGKGIMNGYSNGDLAPEEGATRAMAVTMLWRLAGSPAPTGSVSFTDVEDGEWFSDAAVWAAENGVAAGIGGGSFAPDAPVTREQFAVMLWRCAKLAEAESGWAFLSAFSDAAAISDWAVDALRFAVAEGIIKGAGGAVDPNGSVTRSEIAAMLMRYDEPEEKTASEPIPLIIDADIGNSTDDPFALQTAYRLMDEGTVELIGVIASRMGEGYPDLADLYNTYYGYPNIPIGIERSGVTGSNIYIDYRGLDDILNSDGSKMFARTDTDFSDNPDGWKLYRKLLSEAEDGSVRIVVIGFTSAIVQLMESGADEYSELDGMELIRQKVHSMYFMGTKLGEGSGIGYNLKYNLSLAQRFLENWPSEVPAYISPSPVGDMIEYRPELVLSDLAENEAHPLYHTYSRWNCDTGQMMWDPLCVINAVYPEAFDYSAAGTVSVSDEGSVSFTETADGPFRYQLTGDAFWQNELLSYIRFCTVGR